MKFIKATVKNHLILHGFDDENKEIIESVEAPKSTIKLIAIDRILSINDKFILTTYLDRLIFWEYEESFNDIAAQLEKIN